MHLSILFGFFLLIASLAPASSVVPLAAPAPVHSNEPNLHTGPDGTTYLTYSGPGRREGERALWLATLAPTATVWSAPSIIVSTPHLMENWADFASLTVATDGTLWAQWFERPADPAVLGYSGRIARSHDRGATWSVSTPLGHEFVSLAPLSGGRVMAVWLESTRPPRRAGDPPPPPRPPGPSAPSMALHARLLGPDGQTMRSWVVDPDVCNCCQTSVTGLPGDRLAVAYRGHTPDEMRDLRLVRFDGATWSAPEPLHGDGWQISACPVNGPAIDRMSGDELAAVWFTAAQGRPRVQVKRGVGAPHGWEPVRPVDLGRPLGRVDLVTLRDGAAVVSWLEAGDRTGTASVLVRRFDRDGTLSAPVPVSTGSATRTSGFARLAARHERPGLALIAWTEVLAEAQGATRAVTQVRTAWLDAARFVSGQMDPGSPSVPLHGPAQLELCDPRMLAHAP